METVDRDGSLTLLRAAVAAGAEHFVFTSVSPALPANNAFVRYKREVEGAVRATSMRWTILQPSAFMEIHAGPIAGWDFSSGRARLMGSGRAVIAYVSAKDVAAFAVGALEKGRTLNRDVHITGPEPLTGLDAVAVAERVMGRSFTVQRIPTAALHAMRVALRPFHPVFSTLVAMGLGMQQGERVAMQALYDEFGIQPTRFEEYVRSQMTSR
jgi:uncharacterized protein YbjT (DUF2867 family)